MLYEQQAKLEVLSVVNGINSLTELQEFRDVIARYFADKAQRAIDALWDEGRSMIKLLKSGARNTCEHLIGMHLIGFDTNCLL